MTKIKKNRNQSISDNENYLCKYHSEYKNISGVEIILQKFLVQESISILKDEISVIINFTEKFDAYNTLKQFRYINLTILNTYKLALYTLYIFYIKKSEYISTVFSLKTAEVRKGNLIKERLNNHLTFNTKIQ
ncbi:MAG: hypothetical protein JW917_05035 [Ignavibacteria bacterium]|nr:hypothetical protein [Ignavibacteria bacterium]